MSRKSPDVRPPCGGKDKSFYLGGCGPNHRRRSLEGIPVKVNTTKEKDYASSNYLSPYRNPEQDTAPNCSEFQAPGYICNAGGNGYPFCGQPDPSLFRYSGSVFPVGTKYFNSYVNTAETTSFSQCEAIGSKQVYAKKVWQGRFSYDSRTLEATDEMDWCSDCQIHNFDSSPDQTKFLAIAGNSSISITTTHYASDDPTVSGQVCCPVDGGGETCVDNVCVSYHFDHATQYTANAQSSCHVDIFGNLHVDARSSGSSISGESDPATAETLRIQYADEAWSLLEKGNDDASSLVTHYNEERIALPPIPDRITGTRSHWRLEWDDNYDESDSCGTTTTKTYTRKALEVDLLGGRLTIQEWAIRPSPAHSHCTSDGSHYTVFQSRNEVYSYSGTNMFWILEGETAGSYSFDSQINKSVTATLSSPYMADTVQQTMRNLLGIYPLDNDALLPWRTELDLVGPLVCFDEGHAAPYLMAEVSSTPFSGRLMGAPAPAGIDEVFNPEHKNFSFCISSNELGPCYIKFLNTWGAWSNTVGIPSATQWIDNWTATQMPQGAFVGWNFFVTTPSTCNSTGPTGEQDDTLWGCKYAEVIEPNRRSFNYARPCGIDRFQISQSSARCIAETSGSTLFLEPSGPATNIETGDLVWVCGVSGLDGCWTSTRVDDFTLKLDRCLCTGSGLPEKPIADCGEGMVGKLRWQSLRPAICGRVDILSVTGSNPVTCSLEEPQFLINGDQIIITGAQGAAINGLWTVSVLDASTIALSGSHALGTPYSASTGQAYSPGAPDWRWNDSEPKHEYQTIEWFLKYRDGGEYDRIAARNAILAGEPACDGVSTCPLQVPPTNTRTGQAALGLMRDVVSMKSETQCQAVSPCRPMVAFWSPNGETFTGHQNVQGAVNYGFPSVVLDSQYGGIFWNAILKQTDNDYLWQTPPCPCRQGDDGTYGCHQSWTEDSGDCSGDYAHRPQVEARQEPVEGSPILPAGVHLGCLSPADIAAGRTRGNICPPPAHDPNAFSTDEALAYTPLISYPPYYSIYALEKDCVCVGGNFSDQYLNDGVNCGDIVPAP